MVLLDWVGGHKPGRTRSEIDGCRRRCAGVMIDSDSGTAIDTVADWQAPARMVTDNRSGEA
jgi:hypothetical protein